MRRPRRIFRSSSATATRGGMNPTVLAGLLGALVGAAVILLSMPSALFGRETVLAGMVSADAPFVAVVDGGTLRLRETVIRLHGVTGPTRGQSCSAPGGAYACGVAATEALAALVRGHPVTCRLAGRDAAGFAEGRCDAGGADVNRALVAAGWALARADAADLAPDQQRARQARRGLWRDGAASLSF